MSYAVPKYGSYWPVLAEQWSRMELLPPDPKDPRPSDKTVMKTAEGLLKHKERYQRIEELTGVPWYMIAALHWRESNASFTKQLAQGWPLSSKSKWVPYTGPYATWEESAVAALKAEGKRYDRIVDWRLEKILYYSEKYNGWGYYQYHNKMPSPYIWGATNIQTKGKYVADGKFSSTTWDTQIGVAALIWALAKLDPTIKLVRET